MSIINIICLIILLALSVVNISLEFKWNLQMLQQNSYRDERYTRWLNNSGDTTSINRLLTVVVIFAMLYLRDAMWLAVYPAIIVIGIHVYKLATARYKKPLVFTNRAKRIYGVMLAISAIVIAVTAVVCDSWYAVAIAAMALYALSHVVLLVSNRLLRPVESHINKRYYDDAARILRSMPGLKVIGITGSYGKTSTKHYLNRILQEKYDVLMTPGSYNTTMGVIRTVREYLKPYNDIFICEMGAKQPGDIKEICDLVHPSIGIVTAVGEQHLESFKTIENVQRTKFELIDALPSDGLAVINDDFPFAASRVVSNVKALRYAVNNVGNVSYTATGIAYDKTGTTFTINGPDKSLTLHTRLVGECNISNLMGAVIVAMYLGVPDDKIRYAVDKIEQVEHRLNLKRTPGGITIIDDAFNSNPTGSRMAMDVLAGMDGGKRIVITPGMIELGDMQETLNRELGKKIAVSADVAIVVGEYNREALLSGIREGGLKSSDVHAVGSFAEAQALLSGIVAAGDTVLYENDLPDTFK
ncbi:MAG: UDP-N-acetylmuramoyl-tripeptide--D-alanyl-D-alanine ligase [Pseudoflavonifractor sp.]|nr:UDP-N-acetylmuramoyl-tripeptide--D-alanyl-D-alanine ligase [Pseudoflavonifractor sp.]